MPRVVFLPQPLATALAGNGNGPRRDPADALAAIEPIQVLARSRTTETSIVTLPGTGRAVRKRWRWPRRRDRAKGFFRTTLGAHSPARREHDALLRLRALPSGPFAPAPIGFVEERSAGVLLACTLLIEEIPGAVDLATWLRDERDTDRRRAILADLAVRTRAMHDEGVVDREMHPRNVLVEPTAGRTWKIDVPKQRVGRRPAPRAGAVDDLACLDVCLIRLATPEERTAFFASYIGAAATTTVAATTVTQLSNEVAARRAAHDAREARRLPSLPSDADR